jgi:hypothetical protein
MCKRNGESVDHLFSTVRLLAFRSLSYLEGKKWLKFRGLQEDFIGAEVIFLFYSLYTWTTVFLAPLVISFNDFLVLFSPSR